MDKKIDVEFTPYGMCIITFPDGKQTTMQGEAATKFEEQLIFACDNFRESDCFSTYEDLEQWILSQYREVAQKPEEIENG